MTEESKVSGENSPQDQGAEWQNMDSPEENMSAGMSDEDQARYEEWMGKREAGVEMEDFEGETNQTFKKEHGKYVYDEDGNHVMRERSDSAFDLTPRLKGESNAHYGARLKYNNMLAQKAEEFPWSEEDIRYDDYGNRDRVKEQEDWRAKAGIPSFDEYFESLGGENGDPDAAAETAEEEVSESYWHKIGKEGQRELVHKHPRKMGESNEEWAKRIEEEEGRKIFTADMGANIPNETGASAEAENGSVDSQAAEAQDRAAAGQGDVAADGGASAEEAASEEAISKSESQDVVEAIDSSVDPAAEVAGESDDAAVAEADEVTVESVEDSTDKKAEESAESAEAKERQRLLDTVGTREFAVWLKEKGLTNGDVESKSNEELKVLLANHAASELAKQEKAKLGKKGPVEVEKRMSREDWNVVRAQEFIRKIETGSFESLAEELNGHLDKARTFDHISVAWKEIDALLESCSEDVQKMVAYKKMLATTNSAKDTYEEARRSLREMPAFILPWGKMHDRKIALREDVKRHATDFHMDLDKLDVARYELPDTISDEDKARADSIYGMYLRANGIHEETNVRDKLKDISKNEKGLSEKIHGEEYDNRMRREIARNRKMISDYQESHPDFVLEPDENYANPHFEEGVEEIEDVFEDAGGSSVVGRAKRRLARLEANIERVLSETNEKKVRLGTSQLEGIEKDRKDATLAKRMILTEDTLDSLPEELRGEWRSGVKESETEGEVNSYYESYRVLESLKADDEARAREIIGWVNDEYAEEFIQPFLAKISQYGGEKGKALALEYGKKIEEESAEPDEPELAAAA